jgi:hypothetical protein
LPAIASFRPQQFRSILLLRLLQPFRRANLGLQCERVLGVLSNTLLVSQLPTRELLTNKPRDKNKSTNNLLTGDRFNEPHRQTLRS